VLVGATTVGALQDNNPAGMAEAFQYTASASGTLTRLYIYVDTANTATQVLVGLYTNTGSNTPGSLMTVGTLTSPLKGTWNAVAVPGATVTAGATYWLVVLGPMGSGVVNFRDVPTGGRAQTSAQTNLNSLPTIWTPGTNYLNAPMSAYGATN
jgi:hypothetical protein